MDGSAIWYEISTQKRTQFDDLPCDNRPGFGKLSRIIDFCHFWSRITFPRAFLHTGYWSAWIKNSPTFIIQEEDIWSSLKNLAFQFTEQSKSLHTDDKSFKLGIKNNPLFGNRSILKQIQGFLLWRKTCSMQTISGFCYRKGSYFMVNSIRPSNRTIARKKYIANKWKKSSLEL